VTFSSGRRLRPEDIISNASEAADFLLSLKLTVPPFLVFLVASTAQNALVMGAALIIFMLGALYGNLVVVRRIVQRLEPPRSYFGYQGLRMRVGFAMWSPGVVRRAWRLSRGQASTPQ
jgi:hypothetical protein